MKSRLLGVLGSVAAMAVIAIPGAALADPAYTFTGDITATACGPRHDFQVDPGTQTIQIVATMLVPANDIVLKLWQGANNITSADTLTSPEQITYSPGGELEGTYAAQVCPFVESPAFVPPMTYTAVVALSDQSAATGIPSGSGSSGLVQTPQREPGTRVFAPATVIDAQRTEGEPLNFIDADGGFWVSGPFGTSTQQSWIHYSQAGREYHVVTPVALRPNLPPGGGDTDIVVDDQGNIYFTDLEGLVNLDASVSNDGGHTWRKNPVATQVGVDRQWFAIDNGPTAAANDNTIFLGFRSVGKGEFVYSSPGSLGPNDPVGGVVYQLAQATPLPLGPESSCAQMRFDPVRRNLYYACLDGDHIRVAVGHVEPGQRTGIPFRNSLTPASPGGGDAGDLFPALAVDGKGNVYVGWIDENSHNVYSTVSTDEGRTWSAPIQINSAPSNTNAFLWGAAYGTRVAWSWLGTDAKNSPDNFPNHQNDPVGAAAVKWYGYVAMVERAPGPRPVIRQQLFSKKPLHYGQICTGGIGCTAGGDRVMADYFAFSFDRGGNLRIVFNDTTNPHNGAALMEQREGTNAPKTKVTDDTADAAWPHYSLTGTPGPNQDGLDLTATSVSRPNADTLRFTISVKNVKNLAPPQGKTNSVWLVRFQTKAFGDGGEESYPIFYAGAESVNGGPLSFFAGNTTCVETLPGSCKIVNYPALLPATGKVTRNVITIDVPIRTGFGRAIPEPLSHRKLYSLTGFTFGRTNDEFDLYADVDATAPFDSVLP
jgi:hypothetical protein